jgi:hypothetical protein
VSCSRRLALAAALALLAACGNLPRPFQPDDKEIENPLLVMADRAGVVVMRPIGMPEPVDEEFAEDLAGGLRARDVVAHTSEGNRASPVLNGWLVPGPAGTTRLKLEIVNPDGSTVAGHEVEIDPRDFAPDVNPRRRKVVATTAAASLAAYLQPDAALALPDAPPVFISRVAGAPGDSGRVLERALDYSLRRAKVTLSETPGGRALTVAGRVGFQDKPRDMVALEVEWQVVGANGAPVGSLKQQNEIPASVLTRAWPEIASAIADNAAEGIAEIVNRSRMPAPR